MWLKMIRPYYQVQKSVIEKNKSMFVTDFGNVEFFKPAKISKSPIAASSLSKYFALLPDSAEKYFVKILISKATALKIGSDWEV